MDDKVIRAANAILADILWEASHIVAESEKIISVSTAIGMAILNLAAEGTSCDTTH